MLLQNAWCEMGKRISMNEKLLLKIVISEEETLLASVVYTKIYTAYINTTTGSINSFAVANALLENSFHSGHFAVWVPAVCFVLIQKVCCNNII